MYFNDCSATAMQIGDEASPSIILASRALLVKMLILKIHEHDAGHMTKMATKPIYGKQPFKNLSRTGGLFSTKLGMYLGLQPIIFCSNGVDLDLFHGKVKFDNLGFSIGKSKSSGFYRKYSSL